MPSINDIPGAPEFIDWFGSWPRFHDAEILDLHLDRAGPSWLRVFAWNMTSEVDAKGHYVQEKHVIVRFIFEQIMDLELSGFSPQNVIHSLSLKRTDAGFEFVMEDCYGLSGRISASAISIEFTPGKPT